MRLLTICKSTLALFAGLVSIVGIASQDACAVQLQDGTVWFDKSPRLVGAATTFDNVFMWGATYFFTIGLPEDAGEPLQRVSIAQVEGFDRIPYYLENTQAFVGTRSQVGQALTLKEVSKNPDDQTISVTFDPPVPPGKTVTIALRPMRNPFVDGIYLFRVKTFPAGEKAHGLDLGVARLHFYRRL